MEVESKEDEEIEYPVIRSFAGLTDLGPRVTGTATGSFHAADFGLNYPLNWTGSKVAKGLDHVFQYSRISGPGVCCRAWPDD